ncbi:hypothetical protein JJB09_16870 [Rhizobium sp. KVB221]|uniref:Uncharacterized protein n=1 Tax=Rhizobium setariae TaxID=2801340 RepID=A0A936YQ98_9HYPH|nr:hypothetical protein [Rhizobium setariae]MBL0373698.1 hypothetical protein [Rhizobium setariae]
MLLDLIDVPICRFTAGGTHDGKPAYDAIVKPSPDAAVVIPPHANAVDDPIPAPPASETNISWRSSPTSG